MPQEKPILFAEALAKLEQRDPLALALSSDQWQGVSVAIRERSFFTAGIESQRFLQRLRKLLADHLQGARVNTTGGPALAVGNRAAFVQAARRFALEEGLAPADIKDDGGLKDIRSEKRLNLIFDIQTQAAQDYGTWAQGMDPDLLDEFPAQRFIRVREVETPRPIHREHEGVVRLKTDVEFWRAMNPDFGVPWGPWGFNSGMDVEDVDRDEAEALGLITPEEIPQPVTAPFNEDFSVSAEGLPPAALAQLQNLFGAEVIQTPQGKRIRPQEDL